MLLANLDTYEKDYSPSKIYVQTDRYMYALEDTVWFKAYALDAAKHIPIERGEVIYLDVVDSKGDRVERKKIFAENLSAASDFIIGREWLPGRYKLRAYTKFMLNQDQEYIFNKEIRIVDINNANEEKLISLDSTNLNQAPLSPPSLNIKFFPESGDLVAGISSRVAIKIENYSAELGNVTGTIEDISGNHITPFKVYERGYGLASFTPEKGKKYVAKLDNDPKVHQLPDVKENGYNITVINSGDNVSCILASNITSGLSGGNILIHSRGKVVYHERLDSMVNNSYVLKFDSKEMLTGVNQITFFDRSGIPRSERLFFINNNLSEPTINSDKSIYNKREEVDLSLKLDNGDQKSYDCSISIFEKSNLKGAPSSDNIKSWFLLNSDLRGEIKDPSYYFQNTGDNKRAYLLDLVMMTHGWRRFTWEDMGRADKFESLQFDRELGIYIKGFTGNTIRTKKPLKSKVVLNFFNNDLTQEELVTGEDGRFEFGPFIFEDSLSAVIQARKYKEDSKKDFLDENRNLNINLEPPLILNLKKPVFKKNEKFDVSAYKQFVASNKYSQKLKDRYNSMEIMLSEVVLKAKRKTKKDRIEKIVSKNKIYGRPSKRIIVNDQDKISNRSVFDLLRRIPGVVVSGSLFNPSVSIRGRGTPQYLIDGFPVEQEFVGFININEILVVDILRGAEAAILGSRGGNGVIAIYTGTDPDSKITREESGIVDLLIKGFDKNRQFYSPDYSREVSSVYQPDVRTTLYWNPYILLSDDKETSISFFTSDNTGDYIVITEGLSDEGEPIFATHEFSVQGNN